MTANICKNNDSEILNLICQSNLRQGRQQYFLSGID